MQHYSTSMQRTHILAQEKPAIERYQKMHLSQGQETKDASGIHILLVDDHTLVREGLRHLFMLQEGFQVVGEATEGTTTMRLVERFQPDIVLVDTHHSFIDALALTRRITQTFPSVAVILLTSQCNQQSITQALKSGVRGYLLTSTSLAEVTRAMRIVCEGGTYISSELASTLANSLRTCTDDSSRTGRHHEPQLADMLTAKEIEIVRLVAAGMSNKEIADTLAYSEKTVKNYLSTIFQKLHIRDRTQAAILALKQGLLVE